MEGRLNLRITMRSQLILDLELLFMSFVIKPRVNNNKHTNHLNFILQNKLIVSEKLNNIILSFQ